MRCIRMSALGGLVLQNSALVLTMKQVLFLSIFFLLTSPGVRVCLRVFACAVVFRVEVQGLRV